MGCKIGENSIAMLDVWRVAGWVLVQASVPADGNRSSFGAGPLANISPWMGTMRPVLPSGYVSI